MAIDYLFSPPNPAGAPINTTFRARRRDEPESESFAIGRHVYFDRQNRYGLAFYGTNDDVTYAPSEFPEVGQWAWVIFPTVSVEGQGRFTTLNTYDRAAFTFGFLQFGSHVPEGDFVQWFRKVLALPGARDYFPDLEIDSGRITLVTSAGRKPLEDSASSRPLMDYLNPSGDRLDMPELLASARLIDWTRRDRATRAAQVEVGVATFKKLARRMAKRVALDGEPDDICAICCDILHHGRAGKAWPDLIGSALRASDKREALLAIGADHWSERCNGLRQRIGRLVTSGQLGRHRYNAATGDFILQGLGNAPVFGRASTEGALKTTLAHSVKDLVAFENAPGMVSNNVWIQLPKGFDATRPIIVAVFLHGWNPDEYPVEQQLSHALDQIDRSRKNVVLLAPRLDDKSRPGRFATAGGFTGFLTEAGEDAERLLRSSGVSDDAATAARTAIATDAGVALIAFSGGHAPFATLLGQDDPWRCRVRLTVTLDSLYLDAKAAALALFDAGVPFVHVALSGKTYAPTNVNHEPFKNALKPAVRCIEKKPNDPMPTSLPAPAALLSIVEAGHYRIVLDGLKPQGAIAGALDAIDGYDRADETAPIG